MSLNAYKLDEGAAADGVWFAYFGELKMRIAYAGDANTEYANGFKKAMRKLRHRYRGNEDIPDAEWREAMAPVYADSIILEWKGARWNDGDPELECTRENKIAVLLHGPPDLFPMVIRDAGRTDAYRVLEADAKNSASASAEI